MENAANRIALTGALDTLPEYSHTNHDRNFYRLTLCVERLSGAVDLLPVLAAEDVLNEADLFRGERIAITGQVRSFNNRAPEGRRLIISVYAETLTTTDQPAQNDVSLTGSVCKPPIYRSTPFGREICDMMLAVRRAFGKSDYIPCIAWGRNAQYAARFHVGDQLRLTGRLQSRAYQKQMPDGSVIEKTAYEVSVGHLELLDGAHNADPAQAHPAHAFHAEAAQPQ